MGDPGETLPLVKFEDLKVGMKVLVKLQEQPGKIKEETGTIQEIRSMDEGRALVFVNSKGFPVSKNQWSPTKVYNLQTGSRRFRKQKRSRRVKRRGVRLGTRRIRLL
jgi:hypothetical protein